MDKVWKRMQGEITHIWMSRDTGNKSRYGLRTLGGIAGIVILALLLACGGSVLGIVMGWPAEVYALALCLAVTLLAVCLAAGVGRRSVRDATVFFLMEGDRLFVMDARRLVYQGRDILSHAAAMAEVQQFLRNIARAPYLPAGADEILKVERIREQRTHYALVCQVRHPNRRVIRRTYFLVKGMEDQDLLLFQLERREGWDNGMEPVENRRPFYILISALACGGFAVLCILSHPAVARLPQGIYFPCLGAAFAALCCTVWFVIRQRRGE